MEVESKSILESLLILLHTISILFYLVLSDCQVKEEVPFRLAIGIQCEDSLRFSKRMLNLTL